MTQPLVMGDLEHGYERSQLVLAGGRGVRCGVGLYLQSFGHGGIMGFINLLAGCFVG